MLSFSSEYISMYSHPTPNHLVIRRRSRHLAVMFARHIYFINEYNKQNQTHATQLVRLLLFSN